MTIEELFGTLQMSVVAGWRKHLRSAKYSKHMALDEFYKEMPDKVDDLIEAWMGAHGKKVGNFTNILTSSNLNTLKYLTELKRVCKEGRTLMGGNDELNSLLDDIINLINTTLYKVKELAESEVMDLADFINESLNEAHIDDDELELKKDYEWCQASELSELADEGFIDYDDMDEIKKMEKHGTIVIPKGTTLVSGRSDQFYQYYKLDPQNIRIPVLKDELRDLIKHCK